MGEEWANKTKKQLFQRKISIRENISQTQLSSSNSAVKT